MKNQSKTLITVLLICLSAASYAQPKGDSSWLKQPRLTPKRINNLVHTKLDVSFDFEKSHLKGKAWITLTPHFYPTDSLTLDAKGMAFSAIEMVIPGKTPQALKYEYDRKQIHIKLPRTFKKGELYTIHLRYTAMPDEYEKEIGGDPLLGVKGLFFINPKGTDKNKPTQIWTQGETESGSVWFPTIDQTQQKTTQEILMTVPAKYVSLSNGKLISQKNNADGTRTDYWKMDLPHSPYLFFMGVGDYAVIKDKWRGKEVNYYVEKDYASVARKIFGHTPEMMTFFSRLTGVDFPWVKYSQITGRDYVAGAMENTTATIHQETAQQDARELTDGNIWEGTIAHELFHQWFGDYVTAESWSNLTLNESFANYSQLLWQEYKYGSDAAYEENFNDMRSYLMGNNSKKDLVRFYYADREDMFDAVSYSKGGRILHMLRNYIGDSAFFKGLNLYLTTNKFKAAEAHQLRIALEETSGEDLTWFFNQWYFGNGHPKLDIHYSYNDSLKETAVIVKQIQNTGKLFTLPTFIDIHHGDKRTRHLIWVRNNTDTFRFKVSSMPDLINFDGDKILLCEKKENKTLGQYLHQLSRAGNYIDRREAVEFFGKKLDEPAALEALKVALSDPFYGIRAFALSKLDLSKDKMRKSFEETIATLVNGEKHRPTKADMIEALGKTENIKYKSLYLTLITDSSYSVSGAALEALSKIDSVTALREARQLSAFKAKGRLNAAINKILIASGDESIFDRIAEQFSSMGLTNDKFMLMQQLGEMTGRMQNRENIKKSIDLITGFRDEIPESVRVQTDPYINGMILQGILQKLKTRGETDLVKYLEGKMK
jgi:aminopeptidase N